MRRRLLASVGKTLPYDRRVAYLSSDSRGPYIDTGINLLDGFVSTEIEFSANSAIADSWVFGSYDSKLGNDYNYLIGSYSGWCFGGFSSLFYRPGKEVDVGVRHVFRINLDGGVWFDNMKIAGEQRISTSYKSTAYLFASQHNIPAVNWALPCKIFYCKIWRDFVMVANFVPVVKDSVACMYDEVSGQFFYNQGTGEFTCGELDE